MRSLPIILVVATFAAGSALAQGAAPPTPPAATAPAAGSVATEAQARTAIEAAGYTNVAGLTKSPQGQWNGTAMKDGKAVQLSVNAQGQVAVSNN